MSEVGKVLFDILEQGVADRLTEYDEKIRSLKDDLHFARRLQSEEAAAKRKWEDAYVKLTNEVADLKRGATFPIYRLRISDAQELISVGFWFGERLIIKLVAGKLHDAEWGAGIEGPLLPPPQGFRITTTGACSVTINPPRAGIYR
jgi:hypothetical protein